MNMNWKTDDDQTICFENNLVVLLGSERIKKLAKFQSNRIHLFSKLSC